MAGIIAHIQDLSTHRGLISHLVGRELKARYRGSALGFLWTFLNPLLLLCVYALVFSVYMRIQMDDYAIFMFTGLLPGSGSRPRCWTRPTPSPPAAPW